MLITIIVHLTHVNVQEWMENSCRYPQFIKTHILYYKSCENQYQYCKVLWQYYITTAIVQSYTGKYHCYSCCALVTVHSTSNNANGNQQVTKCQRQQVTKFVSGITSHVSYAWTCNEIGSLCHHHYSDKLYWKKKHITTSRMATDIFLVYR